MKKTQDLKPQMTTDLEKENWVFGQNLKREKAEFSAMNLENLERERELGFWPWI